MRIASATEMQLLALVSDRDQELSGRDIAKLYRQETGRTISYGTLYTTLRRLKESGWITSRDAEDVDGRVRYFLITATGVRALAGAREHYLSLAWFGLPLPDWRPG
jgi:DNA-binding PadR family transcriptional regulator